MMLQLLIMMAFCQRNDGLLPTQRIVSEDLIDGDYFGCSVSVSLSYAVIGAWTQDNYGKSQYGAAYVFARDLTTNLWSQTAKLNASDPSASAFGYAVDIYSTSIVVGSRHNDAMYGSSYVFELDSSSNSWKRTAKLQRNPNSGASYFGSDVSIYDQYIAIGTRNEAAYIFQRDSQNINTWTQTQKLLASDNVDGDYFASSLAMYGSYLVIGADSSDKNNVTTYKRLGSAYIFELDPQTNLWTEAVKLTANPRTYSNFGWSVAIYDKTVLIGAYSDPSDAGNNVGSAYIFELDESTNIWSQSVQLMANDPTANARFGSSVAIYGTYAVIGAKGDGKGSAYVFERDPTTNVWTQTAKLVPSSGANLDKFGDKVALYDKYAMVGMYGDVTGSVHATTLIDYAETFTSDPTKPPSEQPSASPSRSPTDQPSASPIEGVSISPSRPPSNPPSTSRSDPPSRSPSDSPIVPSTDPSRSPSAAPIERGPTESGVASTIATDETTQSSEDPHDKSSQPQIKTLLSTVITGIFAAVAIFKAN